MELLLDGSLINPNCRPLLSHSSFISRQLYFWEKLETISAQPEVAEAMLNRLNRAMSDLAAVTEYLEG